MGEGGESASRTLTVIIHGTFAHDERWWRPGDDPETPTFADRLEEALSARGVAGTVWTPAIEAGLSPDDFAWSGANSHAARVGAGLDLAVTLRRVAKRLQATAAAPLEVNLIAHSHGGNVCLEALRHLRPEVKVRRLVLLGTPLIDRRRSLRVLRAGLALFVIGFMITAGFMLFLGIAGMLTGDDVMFSDMFDLSLGAIVLMTLLGSWTFVLFAGLADLAWQAVSWPIDQIRKRRRQLYGPPAAAVHRALSRRQVLLVTSHYDEADLLLQFGSRPRRLFDQMIRRRWPWSLRLVELVLFRPFIDWMAFYLIEMVLERFALGLPWHRCFLNDFRVADLDRGSSYPKGVYQRVDVTRYLEESLLMRPSTRAHVVAGPNLQGDEELRTMFGGDRQLAVLYAGILKVGRTIGEQVRFLHSRYYASDTVLDLITSDLVDASVDWKAWTPSALSEDELSAPT
ncbi:MAG: hypothetical protein R3A79_10670 [Nannocystaceae bacterium]